MNMTLQGIYNRWSSLSDPEAEGNQRHHRSVSAYSKSVAEEAGASDLRRMLARVQSLGYVVSVQSELRRIGERDRVMLAIRASDERTGATHIVRADDSEANPAAWCINHLLDHIADDLEG